MDSSYSPNSPQTIIPTEDVDSLLLNLFVSNSDSIPHTVILANAGFAPPGQYGSISVPAGAGQGAVPSVDMVLAILGTGNQGLPIPATYFLTVQVGEAITSGHVNCYAQRGFF